MLTLLLACKGVPGDSATEDPQVTGSLSTDDASAEVNIYKAFGRDYDGDALWFFASSPDATCDSVSTYLAASADEHDPAGIWEGGDCVLTLVINPQDSSIDYVPGETFGFTDADGVLLGFWSVRCAMGEGAFEWGTRDEGSPYYDYFWTGVEYLSSPAAWDTTISGDGEDGGYTIEVSMGSQFAGSYPTVVEPIQGSGEISGTIDAEYCADLLNAGAFPDY